MRREHAHVSAERLLSGIGLPVLHRAVGAVLGLPAPALAADEIVERGVARSDEACSRTLDAFCALLGSFAGSMALVFGARGGVYVGGGIVPRFPHRFFASAFRERFEAKGRFRPYLQAVPTALLTDTLAAPSRAALAPEQAARSGNAGAPPLPGPRPRPAAPGPRRGGGAAAAGGGPGGGDRRSAAMRRRTTTGHLTKRIPFEGTTPCPSS